MKKKLLMNTIMVAGILLLASCGPREGIGPIEIPKSINTPTPIVVPTCTPTATPTSKPGTTPVVTEAVEPTVTMLPTNTPAPEPTEEPTAAPTATPEPTVTPAPTATPEPTVTPAPTATLEPTVTPAPTVTPKPTATATPAPTATPEPTVTPKPTATATPEPTATPVPTTTPEPTATPVPTATPEPTVGPEALVNEGWQKTVSIDEEYLVIFPDMFRDSTVERTDKELQIKYLCPEDSNISFQISYVVQITLEEYADQVLDAEKAAVKILPEENRMAYQWQEDGMIYQGILLEGRYAQSLLGIGFGEEEWIDGVMKVVFAYPEAQKEEYETEEYSYFVVNDGEE